MYYWHADSTHRAPVCLMQTGCAWVASPDKLSLAPRTTCVTCITWLSLMQLKNTLPLQDLRMARDSNANWYSVLSKPTTVVLEYLSLPAQHLKCRNLRLSENSSNVLQIFTTNAQEWIQWNIVNVFQPKCENMCHRDVNKFESICSFFSSKTNKNIWIDWGLISI